MVHHISPRQTSKLYDKLSSLNTALNMHTCSRSCDALVFLLLCLYLQWSENASLQKLFEKGDVACKTLVAGLVGGDLCGAGADKNLLQQSLQSGMKLAAVCGTVFAVAQVRAVMDLVLRRSSFASNWLARPNMLLSDVEVMFPLPSRYTTLCCMHSSRCLQVKQLRTAKRAKRSLAADLKRHP